MPRQLGQQRHHRGGRGRVVGFLRAAGPEVELRVPDADVVDAKGNLYVRLSGYRTIAMPGAVNADYVKVLQRMLRPSPVAA